MENLQELVGKRVRLVSINDPYTRLEPGTEGTVVFVDSLGTVHVDWKDGSRLGIVPAYGDRYEVID
jgi:RNase P/RNase MRP subunit p29